LEEKVVILFQKTENMAVGIRCADYATQLYPQKLAQISQKNSGGSVATVR
jgi:hypothetical protein